MRKTIKSIAAAALALSLAALPVVQDMPALQGTSVGIAANAATSANHDFAGQTPTYTYNKSTGTISGGGICTCSVKCKNCGFTYERQGFERRTVTQMPTADTAGECTITFDFDDELNFFSIDPTTRSLYAGSTGINEAKLYQAMAQVREKIDEIKENFTESTTKAEIEAALDSCVNVSGIRLYQKNVTITPANSTYERGFIATVTVATTSLSRTYTEGFSQTPIKETLLACETESDAQKVVSNVYRALSTIQLSQDYAKQEAIEKDLATKDSSYDYCAFAVTGLHAINVLSKASLTTKPDFTLSSLVPDNMVKVNGVTLYKYNVTVNLTSPRTPIDLDIYFRLGDGVTVPTDVIAFCDSNGEIVADPTVTPERTAAEKVAIAKKDIEAVLKTLTVDNSTTRDDVKSAVDNVTLPERVTTMVFFNKVNPTEKKEGSVTVKVSLYCGSQKEEAVATYTLPKLSPNTPDENDPTKPGDNDNNNPVTPAEKTDEEKAAEAKSALESSWLQNGDSSSWLNEKDIAYKEADVHFADTAADILKEKGITAEVTPAGFTKADSDGYVTFTFKIKVGDAETACDIKMKVAVDASAPDAPVTSDKEMAQSAANAFKNTWVYKDPGTQDWITAEDIEKGTHNQTVFAGTWLEGVDLKGASVTVKSEMLDKSKGTAKLTYTFTVGSESVSVETTLTVKAEEASKPDPTPAPVVNYYTVGFTGDYAGSGITVSSLSNTAGSTVTVNVPVGYSVSVISGGSRIASVSDGTGTFTMPNGNVTLSVTSYLGTLTAGYKNAYIYSYDSEMNHIATNSVRGGMKSPEGEVTVKLGKKYAGKSVTLYNGRKSTSSKVDEAVLDKNGQATFTVKSGKNYTLVVE